MDVVKKFIDTQSSVKGLIKNNDVARAKKRFVELMSLYHELADSDVEQYHKELAHQELTKLHQRLSEAEQAVQIPVKFVVAGVLLVAFSVLVFMNPSIVGLITFTDEITQNVDVRFAESAIHELALKDVPLSLRVSGEYEGSAKLFLKRGDDLILIFDSANTEGTAFERVCEDTCELKADSNAIELFAQVEEGSSLYLKEVVYTIPRDDNRAPVWTRDSKNLRIRGQTTIDLNDFFKDPDGDDLVFLSTSAKNLRVVVENENVKFIPLENGEQQITLIASDLDKLTKVPVKVIVQ